MAATSPLYYLDSNAVIFGVEAGSAWSVAMAGFLQAVEERRLRAVTSALTLCEVLVKPLQVGAATHIEAYEHLLRPDGDLGVIPIDQPIIRQAAAYRASSGMKLADAIHVATAVISGASDLITGDERLGRALPASMRWTGLGDIQGIVDRQ